jgi:hypothetical protein
MNPPDKNPGMDNLKDSSNYIIKELKNEYGEETNEEELGEGDIQIDEKISGNPGNGGFAPNDTDDFPQTQQNDELVKVEEPGTGSPENDNSGNSNETNLKNGTGAGQWNYNESEDTNSTNRDFNKFKDLRDTKRYVDKTKFLMDFY